MADTLEELTRALAGRYEIERELGAGGMAVVYLAQDVRHKRPVAVKVLRPELAAVIGADRFLREIEIAARLQHPHILPVYDSGEAGGFLFYVMPFVEGESLRDRLDRDRQLAVGDALQLAREVADALGYAHAHDVVHRDIKPENILLSSGHALVADFGIARAISEAGGDRLTQTGLSIGTPAYMSPEQAAGEGTVDGRSDIYSLACVLYEMLAGEPPHAGPSAQAIIAKRLTEPVPSLLEKRERLPHAVDDALSRALARVPADRFATAPEFANALHREDDAPAARTGTDWSRGMRLGVAAAVTAVIAFGSYVAITGQGDDRGPSGVPRLVVLPFENLGSADDEYFATGITDEVTARLAGLNGLVVIARQSAMQYKGSDKTPQEIGRELDAQYLLEATVSWQRDAAGGASRVRIRPQLVRTSDAGHVWADVYDEDLTEVFAVQTAIANRVVGALGVALLEPEQRSLSERPTDNLEAYDLFLRSSHVWHELFTRQGGEEALPLLERAVQLDPEFALAHATIGEAHRQMYHYFFDRSEARLMRAKEAIDRAVALEPNLIEARLALANYHYSRFDYDRALAELEPVRRAHPNHGELLLMRASVLRRRGDVEESVREYEAGVRVNPRSAATALNLSLSYMLIRDFPAATREMDRAIALAPDVARQYGYRIQLQLRSGAGTAALRDAIAEADRLGVLTAPFVLESAVNAYWLEGRFENALALLDQVPDDFASDHQYWYLTKDLLQAETLHRMGSSESARQRFEAARRALDRLARADPNDARYARALGITLARLDQPEEAVRLARRGVELLPVEREAFRGVYGVEDLAAVYTMVGDREAAIDQLEFLLSIPSAVSLPLLRTDPRWDPLRDHPRFQRLVGGR